MKTLKIIVLLTAYISIAGCVDNEPASGPYPTEGFASWYWSRKTATGEKMDSAQLTCALRKTDFGKYYKVCNTYSNACVVVRHNDFGPAQKLFEQGRIVDLSKAAFSQIADLKEGEIKITITEAPAQP